MGISSKSEVRLHEILSDRVRLFLIGHPVFRLFHVQNKESVRIDLIMLRQASSQTRKMVFALK